MTLKKLLKKINSEGRVGICDKWRRRIEQGITLKQAYQIIREEQRASAAAGSDLCVFAYATGLIPEESCICLDPLTKWPLSRFVKALKLRDERKKGRVKRTAQKARRR